MFIRKKKFKEMEAKALLLWEALDAVGNKFLDPCELCRNYDKNMCDGEHPELKPEECSCFHIDTEKLMAGRNEWWPNADKGRIKKA